MKKRVFCLTPMLLLILCVILVSLSSCDTATPPADETTAQEQPTSDTAVTTDQPEGTESPSAENTQPEDSTPTLDGSFSTPDYEVCAVDGVCYLSFADGNRQETDSDAAGDDYAYETLNNFLTFSSVSEMKRAFKENTLTDKQKNIIRSSFLLTERGYEICNFDQLLYPAAPKGFTVSSVRLYGTDYTYSIHGDGKISGAVYVGGAGKYEREYAQRMEIISNHQLDSHTTETYDGVACESYVITTNVAQIKYVFMTMPAEGKDATTRIIMRFLLRSDNQPDDVSVTVPSFVLVFGDTEDGSYGFLVQGLEEAPTAEWLSSFFLRSYVDETPESAS